MGLSGYMAIGIVVLLAALAGTGYLLKGSYERNGALEQAAKMNALELKRAVDKNTALKELRELDQTRILALSAAEKALEDDLARSELRYDKWRSTLDTRTLAKPEVTRRAARKAIRIRQCKIWRDTGGLGKCPL